MQRCQQCATYVFIPQSFCRACRSTDLRWVQSAGRGAIVTFTVVWRPQTPAFEVPYVVAVVELDEGWEMLTNIVGGSTNDVAIGAPVEVCFMPMSPEITLPCFKIVRAAEGAP